MSKINELTRLVILDSNAYPDVVGNLMMCVAIGYEYFNLDKALRVNASLIQVSYAKWVRKMVPCTCKC